MTIPTADSTPRYTDEQRLAIETRGVSVALSAGAGCGKTFVLTERFLAYFNRLDRPQAAPQDLSRVVAITFTERAAREMRDRIRRKCHDRLLAAEEEDAGYWTELLRGLDGARISTIHSFCAALLRSRAVEAGVDPNFAVLEQAQAETLLSEVVDDALRQALAERNPLVFELAARFDLPPLRNMLQDLARECTSRDFAEWLQVSPDEQLEVWNQCFQRDVLSQVVRQITESPAARTVLHILREHTPNHPEGQARRDVLLAKLPALAGATDGPTVRSHLEDIQASARVQGGGTAKAWDSPETYATFRDAAKNLRDLIDEVRPLTTFEPNLAREAAEIGGQLFSLADQVYRRYAESKQELNALDFNDLMSLACQLLADPLRTGLKKSLSAQIDLLLVDEFQDTDPLQVELVRALCDDNVAGGKLFFVGDYKQSIYRFRGAEPDVFRTLRDQTALSGQLLLTRNFRSQPAILHFANALFWHDLGNSYEALRPDRHQISPEPAIEFLWAHTSDDIQENKEAERAREADWIARRMRELIDSGQPLVYETSPESGQPVARAARPGDFAILFRALSNVEIYEAALRRHGLDYYLVGGHAFYAQQEIFDLLNLLRTLNSRADQVSLAGVLRSGFFSLADETLFWLSSHAEGLAGGLFAADYPAEISPEQQQRARFAATTLTYLRDCKDRLRICELIDEALERTGYDAVLLSEFLGERKLANLRKLVEQARSFEQGDLFGLADFITQLAQFVARQPDEPLAATQAEDTDVVRLMTIHQSKGLEFPIVIVPDLGRKRHDPSEPVHFDTRLGPLVRLRDNSHPGAPAGGYELWRFLEKSQEAAELKRLLYVATTRAADYLLLSSSVSAPGAVEGPWLELLASRFDLTNGRLVGPLPQEEPRPQIRVTSVEPPLPRSEHSRQPRVDVEKLISEALAQQATSPTSRQAVDPIEPDRTAWRQFSFSRLAGTIGPRREIDFSNEAAAASVDHARELGTLIHAVLAVMDFEHPQDAAELIDMHAPRHLPAGAAEIAEAKQLIARFAASPRAAQLAQARANHAEVEFLLAWPPDGQGPRETMIRGYLDRLVQDADGHWHVLDFKTNRVVPGQLAAHAAPYAMQMLVYALATESILGSAPASLTLHFLRTGEEFVFTWDDAARKRVVQMVDQAITAVRNAPGA